MFHCIILERCTNREKIINDIFRRRKLNEIITNTELTTMLIEILKASPNNKPNIIALLFPLKEYFSKSNVTSKIKKIVQPSDYQSILHALVK